MESLFAANLFRTSRIAAVIAVGLLAFGSSLVAQEESVSPAQATTTSDATVAVDHLQVSLRPLTKDELEIELQGWLNLVPWPKTNRTTS